ncbi:MAG: apolipoprotein N-acyltransferase, partial [Gammaproteobacteria bacterium]|nr:apolipoprotein N-acyltransferase [Gammaproteobacteria bacterium]
MVSRRLLPSRGASLALGAGLPLSFAPFAFWWAAPLLFAGLFLLLDAESTRERALRAFSFGFGAFVAGTWWLYISIHDFGGLAAPIAASVVLLLILIMALYHAAWILLCSLVRCESRAWQLLAILPAGWTLIEWLRGWMFSGFPWLSIGYGQIDGPLAAWAPLVGVHGISLLVLLIAGALAVLIAGEVRTRLAAVLLLGLIAGGTVLLDGRQWTTPEGEPLEVALVQGGITQDRKWLAEELESTMALYSDLTIGLDQADLIIWPEAAIPALAHEVEDYLTAFAELAKARKQTIVLGILTYEFDTDAFYNSLLMIGEGAGLYNKRHLVPFGEYFPVPGFIRNMLRLMNLPYQDINAGAARQWPLRMPGVALAPTICYEDVFGTELRGFLPEAGLLVNVSNDAWFGDSIAPHQHLQMARFRALEAGRYMLRSTNTGITAIIDAQGRVTGRGKQFGVAVVTGRAQPQTGATPWVRFGNAPVLSACLLLLLLPVFVLKLR